MPKMTSWTENGDVRQSDAGQFGLAQQADHKGIDETQRAGEQVLQNNGYGKEDQIAVKGLAPVHKTKHKTSGSQDRVVKRADLA